MKIVINPNFKKENFSSKWLSGRIHSWRSLMATMIAVIIHIVKSLKIVNMWSLELMSSREIVS